MQTLPARNIIIAVALIVLTAKNVGGKTANKS